MERKVNMFRVALDTWGQFYCSLWGKHQSMYSRGWNVRRMSNIDVCIEECEIEYWLHLQIPFYTTNLRLQPWRRVILSHKMRRPEAK